VKTRVFFLFFVGMMILWQPKTVVAQERELYRDGHFIFTVWREFDKTGGDIKIITYAMIVDYTGPGGNVQIPSLLDGLPVIAVLDEAFLNKGLTGISIPGTVTGIGPVPGIGVGAFAANHLTSVSIPDGVTIIGEGAFYNNLLTSVSVPGSVQIGENAFARNGPNRDRNATVTRRTQPQQQLAQNAAQAAFERGNRAIQNGDYDTAIAEFTQAIRINPNYIDAYNGRGLAYAMKNDLDTATADFTQAIRINPKDAGAYYLRGLTYKNKKDYNKAIADFTQAIRLNPNDADAFYYRGHAYYLKKDYKKAIADYEAALRINPNHADARQNLEIARQAQGR
jgi:Flp pilus assembly protein TadD